MTARMVIGSGRDLVALADDDVRFRDWYDATLPRVYRYLAARCGGDEALVEELTQQTFVDAVRHLRRFDGRSDVVTWLIAIARARLVDHHRRHGRDARRHARLVADQESTTDAAWRASDARASVEAALAALPADQRLALLFRYLDGLTVREVATALGRSEKATESLLGRAREAFRRAYGGSLDA